MLKSVIFSGGGSGGHTIPAMTLIKALRKISPDLKIYYIGGKGSFEEELVTPLVDKYYPISTGKLRRYFSVENFKDVFRVLLGIIQSTFILLRFSSKNSLLFSTGGFVSVPAVIGAFITRKRIVVHEQTARAGLANRIASKFADEILLSFEDKAGFFPKGKKRVVGYPVRDECFTEEVEKIVFNGKDFTHWDKPIIFVTGGGNGAELINQMIFDLRKSLEDRYTIIHQVGKNFIHKYGPHKSENYLPMAFVGKEMIDLFKMAEIVISRAGAGTVSELLALKKKSIFIPLKIAQNNEQLYNAKEAEESLGSVIITEDEFDQETLLQAIGELDGKRVVAKSDIASSKNPVDVICHTILKAR